MVTPGLDAIMVPKVEDLETLPHVDAVLAAAERAAGMEPGAIRVLAILETPKALARCEEILAAAPERLHTAVFGAGDYTTELGIDLTRDATEILWARCRLVNAVRAAGLAAPIDGPWLRLEDVEGLEADCLRARALGYQGRVTVYPPQVETVLRAYSSLPEEEETGERASSRSSSRPRREARVHPDRRSLRQLSHLPTGEGEAPALRRLARANGGDRMSELPLAGVRVVDVATLFAGPLVATILGDYGADVIKVEHPTTATRPARMVRPRTASRCGGRVSAATSAP